MKTRCCRPLRDSPGLFSLNAKPNTAESVLVLVKVKKPSFAIELDKGAAVVRTGRPARLESDPIRLSGQFFAGTARCGYWLLSPKEIE